MTNPPANDRLNAAPAYSRDRDALTWTKTLETGNELSFRASHISRRASGVQARVGVYDGPICVASDLFGVEKLEERVRLANAAHKALNKEAQGRYPAETLKLDLARFCDGLWDVHLQELAPKMCEGVDEETEPVYLLNPFVLHEAGTLVFAPPGAGKSFLTLLMAVSIDAGCNAVWPTLVGSVLFVNLERSEKSVLRRLARVNRCLGLDASRPLLMLHARGHSLLDVLEPVRRAVEEHSVACVVLDSISRAGLGKLVEDQTANAAIDALNSLCPTWLAIAHSPRASDEHVFGSVHFDAGADLVVRLMSQLKDSTLGVRLEVVKANDTPTGTSETLALEFDKFGLNAVRKANKHEFPELAAKRKQSLLDEVRDYVLECPGGRASPTDIANDLGRSRQNISQLLAHSDEFVAFKDGRKTLYGLRAANQ